MLLDEIMMHSTRGHNLSFPKTKENASQLGIHTLELCLTPSSGSDINSTWLLTAGTVNKVALLIFKGVIQYIPVIALDQGYPI